MNKDFDGWHILKKNIEQGKRPAFYHEREVWWCSLGVNVGFEQDGTGENYDRPVVVLKGFSEDAFLGVALTGKKRTSRFYLPIGKIDEREASAILSQIRFIDTKRLIRKIETLDEGVFNKLKDTLKNTLFS